MTILQGINLHSIEMAPSYCLIVMIMAMTGVLAVTPSMYWISPKNASVNTADFLIFPEVLSAPRGVWSEINTGAGSRAGMPIFHVDSKGSMWIYGGSADGDLNAMWNYDPVEDKYRWVAGNASRIYSQQGVPADDVSPGSTTYSANAIDKNDVIWIYAPSGDDSMWMFNTTSLQFTWLRGDGTQPTPIAGDLGQASPDYWPGAIQGACMVVDSKNNLWLIGGSNEAVVRSSVWHFNTSSHEWSLQVNETGSTLSGPDYENKIWNGRWAMGCTIDEDDRVWLFGGNNRDSFSKVWNDMWSFDTKTVTWRVERETNDTFRPGNVVTLDTFDASNYPCGRDLLGMVDRRDGTLMLYGGRDPGASLALNDIWVFNKTSKLWKVVFGLPNNNTLVRNTFGTYRGAGSKLGSRTDYSIESGLNAKGNMIIFGGSDFNNILFNDIWIIPQEQCSTNLNDCDPHATCTMATWTYTCTCNEGYTGDGKTCTAVPSAVPVSQPQTQQPHSTPSKTTSGSSHGLVPSLFVGLLLALLTS